MKFTKEEFEVLFCGLARVEDFARVLEIETIELRNEIKNLKKTIESTYDKLSKMEREEVEEI